MLSPCYPLFATGSLLVVLTSVGCTEKTTPQTQTQNQNQNQTAFRPDFYDQVEPIRVRDGLAVTLGAIAEEQPLVYSYRDAVKLAGHSCLAISGAYRLTQIALTTLYGDDLPDRGEIEVVFKGAVDHKVNGPISQVVTLVTGAAAENGFHGFGDGRFKRDGLLRFDTKSAPPAEAVASATFKRIDTGKTVRVTYANQMVPANPDMQERVKVVLLGELHGMFTIELL